MADDTPQKEETPEERQDRISGAVERGQEAAQKRQEELEAFKVEAEAKAQKAREAAAERLSRIKERSAKSAQDYQKHVEEVKSRYGQKPADNRLLTDRDLADFQREDPEPKATPSPSERRPDIASAEIERKIKTGQKTWAYQGAETSASDVGPQQGPQQQAVPGQGGGIADTVALNAIKDAILAKLDLLIVAVKEIGGPLS